MRDKSIILAVWVAVLVFAAGAADCEQFAEVGGDVLVRGFYRDSFTMSAETGTSEDWLETTARLGITWPLTDHIEGVVRLISESDWGGELEASTEVEVDLAYVVIEELGGSTAAFTIGRQEMMMGEGFLVARNSADSARTHYEQGVRKSFDAIRGDWVFGPYELLVGFMKVEEGLADAKDDVNVFLANLSYDYRGTGRFDFGAVYKNDETDASDVVALTVRGEGDLMSVPGVSLRGELVPQWGEVNATQDLSAFGGYGELRYELIDNIHVPFILVRYTLLSGEEGPEGIGDSEEFDPMYEDMYYGHINNVNTDLGLNTNATIIQVAVGCRIREKLAIELSYFDFTLSEVGVSGSDDYGSEIDLELAYQQSERVEFGLAAGRFEPGATLAFLGNESATQFIGWANFTF